MFDDYCYMAIDKYPDNVTTLQQLFQYQKDFIEEFLRDIMYFWGKSKIIPKIVKPMLVDRRRKKRLK